MPRFCTFWAVTLLGLSLALGSCKLKGQKNITASELLEHVEYLAADELAGREMGTSGVREAEHYIANEFAAYELAPLPDQDDYFLEFVAFREGFNRQDTSLSFWLHERMLVAELEGGFRPFDFSGGGNVEAAVVFAGYGITAPEYGYDDYAGLDVSGEFVFVLRHEPGEQDHSSLFAGATMTRHALFVTEARNVAACILGRDPALRDQWIVVGAHHDHLGSYAGEGDTVFNGADDNASGIAAVLELSEALAAARRSLRRSVVFVTFTGEEKGLLGSRFFVDTAAVPPAAIVLMLNIDMIGRNVPKHVTMHANGRLKALRTFVDEANTAQLPLDFKDTLYGSQSDHTSFALQRVAALFVTTGIHEDYHRASDHSDRLEYQRMEDVVQLLYRLVVKLASVRALNVDA